MKKIMITTMLLLATVVSAHAEHGKIKFTYHQGSAACEDNHGNKGYNPNQFIECGNLTGLKQTGGKINESLAGSVFNGTVMENVDFRASSLHGVSFRPTHDMAPINSLRGSDLRGVDMGSATGLFQVYLEGAKFDIQTKFSNDFGYNLVDQVTRALDRGMVFYRSENAVTNKNEVLRIVREATSPKVYSAPALQLLDSSAAAGN